MSCKVPESNVEIFDCCGSDEIEDVCQGLGALNLLTLSAMIFLHVYYIITNKWYRNQPVVFFCVLMYGVVMVWRTITLLFTMWPGSGWTAYSLWRMSASGDLPNTLGGLLVLMWQLNSKYNDENNYSSFSHKLKFVIIWWAWFWIWGLFWWNALYIPGRDDKDLYNHNIGMSIVLVVMIFPFIYMARKLQNTLETKYSFTSAYDPVSNQNLTYTSVTNNIALPQLASSLFLAFCVCVPDSCEFLGVCTFQKDTPSYSMVLIFVSIAEFIHLFVTMYGVYYLYDLDLQVEYISPVLNDFAFKPQKDFDGEATEMQQVATNTMQ